MNQIELQPITYKYPCSICESILTIEEIYEGLCNQCGHEFDNSNFEIEIKLPFKPIPKKSPRFSKKTGKFYNPSHPEMDMVKDYIKLAYKSYLFSKEIPLNIKIECRLLLPSKIPKIEEGKYTEFFYLNRLLPKPTSKPDIDNILKFVNDCLSGLVYNDDRQITTIIASKRYAEEEGILIKIRFDD